MFSFGSQSSPFDEVVEKATAETLLEENWGLMMDISDKVQMEGQKACKHVLLSIKKRLNNRDPHVVIYALSLLDCLWKNAGPEFRRSVSSKDFVPELKDKSISSINAVAVKACKVIKEWSENECSKDASLALISSLYKELNDQGLFFENNEPKKTKQAFSTDPNVVSSAEEEAQLALAIAASLNDASIKKTPSTSQYPSLSQTTISNNPPPPSYREVKALYDFEKAEDNELTMRAGDSIMVLEDSDANWWKGQSHRGVGLFPSSFVTSDLIDNNINNYANGTADTPIEEPPVQIDEEALLKCIQLLEECDPTGETPDPPALAYFENMALQMAPLIDKKLANIDRQHNMLANVDISMRDVLAVYDQAVQQVQIPQMPQMYGNIPQQGYGMPGAAPSPFPQQMNQPNQFLPQQQGYGISGTSTPQQFHQHMNQFGQFPPQQQGYGISNVAATQFAQHLNQQFPPQQQGYGMPGAAPSPFPQQMSQPGMFPPPHFSQQMSHSSSPAPQQQQSSQQPGVAAQFVYPQQQQQPSQQTLRNEVQPLQESQVPKTDNQFANQGVNQQSNSLQQFTSSTPVPQQPQQSQQPIAANFVLPQQQQQQQQTITNEVQPTQKTEAPKQENQFLNQVANDNNISNHSSPIPQQQQFAHSSPVPPQQQQQSSQPIAAARFVHPQQQPQQTNTNEVQPTQGVQTPQPENQIEQSNNSAQQFAHPSPLPPQQQSQQPPQQIVAAHFVHPQQQQPQQTFTNYIQPAQEIETQKPENQFVNQVAANGQGNSIHSSPIPQQSQQPIAAAHLVRPQQQQQQAIANDQQEVQENENPIVNEETFVTI